MIDIIGMFLGNASDICKDIQPVLRIIGIVILGVKIVVPIILILMGMFDMAKAVSSKDEGEIKKTQSALVKKAVAAVIVFLIATIVGLLMNLVGDENYKDSMCIKCINAPFSKDCELSKNAIDGAGTGTTTGE